jgi:hypothetical protein
MKMKMFTQKIKSFFKVAGLVLHIFGPLYTKNLMDKRILHPVLQLSAYPIVGQLSS